MSQLVVVGFNHLEDARNAMRRLRDLERAGRIRFEDTAIVERAEDGKAHVRNEASGTTETGAAVGAVLGGLLLFAMPVVGIAIGAAVGCCVRGPARQRRQRQVRRRGQGDAAARPLRPVPGRQGRRRGRADAGAPGLRGRRDPDNPRRGGGGSPSAGAALALRSHGPSTRRRPRPAGPRTGGGSGEPRRTAPVRAVVVRHDDGCRRPDGHGSLDRRRPRTAPATGPGRRDQCASGLDRALDDDPCGRPAAGCRERSGPGGRGTPPRVRVAAAAAPAVCRGRERWFRTGRRHPRHCRRVVHGPSPDRRGPLRRDARRGAGEPSVGMATWASSRSST